MQDCSGVGARGGVSAGLLWRKCFHIDASKGWADNSSCFYGPRKKNCEINGERHVFNFAPSHLSACGSVFVCQRLFPTSRTEVCSPYRRRLPIYDPSSTRKHFYDCI